MELTKYAHACALITKGTEHLLIDPGVFTELPADLPKIDVLIITHNHPDHLDKTKVDTIIAANPEIQIFGSPEAAIDITTPSVKVPETNQDYQAGSFSLRFYGGQHAIIHSSIPTIGNFGVCINGDIYYPGDSFTPGPEGVAVLLAPALAPWMKIGEGMDFVLSQKAKLVIPTHDGFGSELLQNMSDDRLNIAAVEAGGQYKRLRPGESVNV
jgi:L-ascorbate metabolism protein UlaG (beta-lactamase superfamily)